MNNDIRNLSKWLNEEQEAPIDRQALARVLAMAEQPAQHQCRFPMCHNEEYQQALAEQIKRELYTGEPAQRTWVGLTAEDWQEIADKTDRIIWPEVRQAIEAKLKEKNSD